MRSEPTVTLTVTATDAHGLSAQQEFILQVVDMGGVTIYGTAARETIDSTRTVVGQFCPTPDEDIIFSMAGNDTIRSLGGDDSVDCGIGNDTAYGNDGADTITGGAGNDKLYGENGDDTFVVSGIDDQKDIFSGGNGTDKILVAGLGDLTLATFNASSSSIELWEGNGGAILGTSSKSILNLSGLSAVTNVAYVDGAAGNDTVTGTVFADDLRGSAGKDSLYGGGGDDDISGGTGKDILTGGDGADRFAFSEMGSSNRDTILDYSFADNDMIDVSALLDAVFDGPSNVANFARLTAVGQDLVLQVDVNGPTEGAAWSDVAYLSGASVVGQVLVYFEQQALTLSAA